MTSSGDGISNLKGAGIKTIDKIRNTITLVQIQIFGSNYSFNNNTIAVETSISKILLNRQSSLRGSSKPIFVQQRLREALARNSLPPPMSSVKLCGGGTTSILGVRRSGDVKRDLANRDTPESLHTPSTAAQRSIL